LSFLDLEHFLLPDCLTYPGLALGLVLSLILPHLSFRSALLGALLGGASFYLIAWVYHRLTGREGLGGGDVKLMALIGAYLGAPALPWVVLLGAFLGSVAGLALAAKHKQGARIF